MFPGIKVEIISQEVPSGVSIQPRGTEEIMRGALNRANNVREAKHDANYWVGIEVGVDDYMDEMSVYAWIVVLSEHQCGKGRTGTFFLPEAVAELIRDGMEMGDADDIVFGRTNSKQANGAIGLLTNDVVDRTGYYEEAVIMALIPFKNPELYPPNIEQ
jgi:inosine/xanthosine triphosphatase